MQKSKSIVNDILLRSISYFDNQESFYHGFLVGLLNDYEVVSNRESGMVDLMYAFYQKTYLEQWCLLSVNIQ